MMYEPYFPERFTWLVENPHTGGRPLEEAGREFSDIYGFGRRFFRPSTKEVRQSRDEIVRHLQAVDLRGGDEDLAHRLFIGGGFFGEFLNLHLSKGLYFSALFESMLDAGRPRAVVVGNPVFEGYLLQQAKKRQVPTVLLQHGILGDYCQFWDPPVDDYVVRGSFWREFLADLPRRRAVVLNPPQETGQNLAPERGGRHILFLTAPYSMQEFFNELDLDEILRTLLAASTAHARQLLVRVHPIESVDYYRRKMEKLKNGKGGQVDVRFSHGPGLDVAVRGASVAVTYCSTVFLDCLRAGVPVVSFGWHDFSFKQQIGDRRLFHYARTLAELDALVGAAIKGELHSHSGAVESFLATTGEAELREAFARMTGG